MGIMGWSSTAMAARYQHVTDPIRRTVADQVGGLLWADQRSLARTTETKTETRRLAAENRPQAGPASALVRTAEDTRFELVRA